MEIIVIPIQMMRFICSVIRSVKNASTQKSAFKNSNKLYIPVFSLLLFNGACGQKDNNSTPKMADGYLNVANSPNQGEGFALMELFTSQGCSSCPPADEILGEYASKNNPSIIALAFHVDYWNYIGWKDPYSSSKFTGRQRLYSESLKSSVYTPQLVINGKHSLVGSNKKEIAGLIQRELGLKSVSHIEIVSATFGEGHITVKYTCHTNSNGYTINAALVRKKETTKVNRGENSGRKLTNYNIVTNFISMPLKGKNPGELSFPFDATSKPDDHAIVIYIQKDDLGEIIAAAISDIQ